MTGASLLFAALALWQAAPPSCSTADDCRLRTREAIAAQQFELAHDLAWLAYQKGSRTDPETLTLLARAQSLSGRGDDAFVMLRRLAAAGVPVNDVATSDDFQRVRSHAQWSQLLALFDRLNGASEPDPPAPTPTAKESTMPAAAEAKPPAAAPPAVTPPAATAAAPTSASAPVAEVTVVEAVRAGEDLAMPGLSFAPAALAFDAVSARFILSAASSDALTVLSQTSANATAFTSRGWSGSDKTTAIAIDRGAGDLWVAVHGGAGAALHRLQLISGRRLDAIEIPADSPAELISLTLSRGGLFALDRAGRRILRRTGASTDLDRYVTLPKDVDPIAMADAGNALYVAHPHGVIRVDLASRRQQPVSAAQARAVTGLQSVAWHDGVLIGVQQHDDEQRVVRLRLNAAGTVITRVEALGPASSHASTLVSGVFYYLTDDAEGRRVVRAISVMPTLKPGPAEAKQTASTGLTR